MCSSTIALTLNGFPFIWQEKVWPTHGRVPVLPPTLVPVRVAHSSLRPCLTRWASCGRVPRVEELIARRSACTDRTVQEERAERHTHLHTRSQDNVTYISKIRQKQSHERLLLSPKVSSSVCVFAIQYTHSTAFWVYKERSGARTIWNQDFEQRVKHPSQWAITSSYMYMMAFTPLPWSVCGCPERTNWP